MTTSPCDNLPRSPPRFQLASNSNIEAIWPEGGELPSFVNWSRSSEYNRSGLMTRLGMPTKNVDLFFRKTFSFAPEVPHISFWMSTFCLHHELICRVSKIRCQTRVTPRMGSKWTGIVPKTGRVTGAVQHQKVLKSLQLLHRMKSLKQTTSQKQISEKGLAHFRDKLPDQCTLDCQVRCWKRLPLSPLVALHSDWRQGCKSVSLLSSYISLHTLLCSFLDRMRWEKVNPSQSALELSWHPFAGNSQQRINHESGFCSPKRTLLFSLLQ